MCRISAAALPHMMPGRGFSSDLGHPACRPRRGDEPVGGNHRLPLALQATVTAMGEAAEDGPLPRGLLHHVPGFSPAGMGEGEPWGDRRCPHGDAGAAAADSILSTTRPAQEQLLGDPRAGLCTPDRLLSGFQRSVFLSPHI